MKRKVLYVAVFLTALLIGSFSVWPFINAIRPISEVSAPQNLPLEEFRGMTIVPSSNEIADEGMEWQEDDPSTFTIKLQEPGYGFHGDEVNAKNGETWLGLFKEGNDYFLRSSKVIVSRTHDPVIDDEDSISGKDVRVTGKNQPIFMLKNARMLRDGKVKTLFDAGLDSENAVNLINGFTAEYHLKSKKYTLRVTGATNSSKLTLESGDIRQNLYFVERMGDATWSLLWVGDLDGDGKLDLYADINGFYNFSEPRLFLSSEAKKGRLVRQVAMTHTSGC